MEISRRDLLISLGVGSAALPLKRAPAADRPRPLRLGVIGAGSRGKELVRQFERVPGCQLRRRLRRLPAALRRAGQHRPRAGRAVRRLPRSCSSGATWTRWPSPRPSTFTGSTSWPRWTPGFPSTARSRFGHTVADSRRHPGRGRAQQAAVPGRPPVPLCHLVPHRRRPHQRRRHRQGHPGAGVLAPQLQLAPPRARRPRRQGRPRPGTPDQLAPLPGVLGRAAGRARLARHRLRQLGVPGHARIGGRLRRHRLLPGRPRDPRQREGDLPLPRRPDLHLQRAHQQLPHGLPGAGPRRQGQHHAVAGRGAVHGGEAPGRRLFQRAAPGQAGPPRAGAARRHRLGHRRQLPPRHREPRAAHRWPSIWRDRTGPHADVTHDACRAFCQTLREGTPVFADARVGWASATAVALANLAVDQGRRIDFKDHLKKT